MSNKIVYPIVIKPISNDGFHLVCIPDIDGYTQGKDIPDAIDMARDYIGNAFVLNDEPLQEANTIPIEAEKDDIVTLVDVDVTLHKKKLEQTLVKKTLSIPSYLNDLGMKSGINFSQTLSEALEEKLGV